MINLSTILIAHLSISFKSLRRNQWSGSWPMAQKRFQPIIWHLIVSHNPLWTFFTCFIDGSWKADDPTSGVDWVLELQDGTTDLIGLQGSRSGLSSLHTEMYGILWAMSYLQRKKHFCSLFVTDSKQLTLMVSNSYDWPGFTS